MMTRVQMREAIKRFLADEDRVLSERLFCQLAGISKLTFRKVFHGGETLTPMVQLRVEKALKALERGEVRLMQNRDRTKYVEYRREPQPELRRSLGLQMKNGKIELKIGLRNANDYTQPTFKEQFEK